MANYILGTLAGLYYPGGSATLSGSLAGLEGSLEGGQKYATISGELAGLEGSLTGYSNRFGQVVGELSGLEGSITALSGNSGVIAGTLAGLTGRIVATPHKIAVISGILSGLSGRLTGYTIPVVTISGALAGLSGSIVSLGSFYTVSINPLMRGVTNYDNFNFDSFFEDEGNYYAIGSSGNVYLLSGADDAGTAIAAYFDSGDTDYFNGVESRLAEVQVLGRTSGNLEAILYADDGAGNTYPSINDTTGNQQTIRFKGGKGGKGLRWRYRIKNVAGSSLEAQKVTVLIADLSRKR